MSEKTYYKLGPKAQSFWDPTQIKAGGEVETLAPGVVAELVETARVASATATKWIVVAKEEEYKEYQKKKAAIEAEHAPLRPKKKGEVATPVSSELGAAILEQVKTDAGKIVDDAKAKSDQIIADAETRVKEQTETVLSNAQATADQIIADAQSKAKEILEAAAKPDAGAATGTGKAK